jgi:hypothetical protein
VLLVTLGLLKLLRQSLALRFRKNSNTLRNQIVVSGKCPSA